MRLNISTPSLSSPEGMEKSQTRMSQGLDSSAANNSSVLEAVAEISSPALSLKI